MRISGLRTVTQCEELPVGLQSILYFDAVDSLVFYHFRVKLLKMIFNPNPFIYRDVYANCRDYHNRNRTLIR
jgi:hypothetical protein